jgi:hypothetical protein
MQSLKYNLARAKFMPMGQYADFAACVKANSDKGDPKAYCGSIKNKVEGKMANELFFKIAELKKSAEAGDSKYEMVVSSTAVDYDNERMSRKALLGMQTDLMHNTSVFFNHKYEGLAVAKTVKTWVTEDNGETYLHAEIEPTKQTGPIDSSGIRVESIVGQLAEGTLKCASVGGKKVKSFDDTTTKGVTVLDEVKALEFSIVGIGANPDAMAKSFAKSMFVDSMKGRLASAAADEELDDPAMKPPAIMTTPDKQMPIVAPVKADQTKDKKKIVDEGRKNEFTAGYIKGDTVEDVKKENGPITPNQPPVLAVGADKERYKKEVIDYLLRLIREDGAVPVSGASKSAEVEVEKKVEVTAEQRLEKAIERLEKMNVSPQGLAVQESKFEESKSTEKKVADTMVNTRAVDAFASLINTG